MKKENKHKKGRKNLQTQQVNGSLSTLTNKETTEQLEPTLQQDTQLPATYHQKCSELLYDTFIKVMVEEDVTHLIISGIPTLLQLQDAWYDILQEYSELIQSEKAKSIFEAWRKCVYTDWQIKYVESVIFKFRMKHPETGAYLYDAEHAARIVELGYESIDPPEDEEVYLNQVNMLESMAKTLIVFLNQYTVDYNLLNPKQENPIKRKVADYDTELAVLSKFMGDWLDKKIRTVSDVCSVINVYNQYIDQQKKAERHGT
jgi:hypothetical protein